MKPNVAILADPIRVTPECVAPRTDVVAVAARVVGFTVALLFLYAGLAKLRQPADFLRDVYAYRLIGPPAGRYLAMLLPHLEIVAGGFLLLGLWPRAAGLVLASLCLVFAAAQGWAMAHGLTIDCGCFAGQEPVSAWTLARTLALAFAASFAALLGRRR